MGDQEKEQDGKQSIVGGVFDNEALPGGVGINEGSDEGVWIVQRDKPKHGEIFQSLEQENGKVTGRAAKEEMMKSHYLTKCWEGFGSLQTRITMVYWILMSSHWPCILSRSKWKDTIFLKLYPDISIHLTRGWELLSLTDV